MAHTHAHAKPCVRLLRSNSRLPPAGVYHFEHAGGTFDVHLRPGGQFFAPQFMARSSWELTEDRNLLIDFGKFGDYRLAMTNGQPAMFEGSAVGQPSNWRKMCFKAPFSPAYRKLMDSVWNFEHAGGSFPVEFRADSFNHFVCKDFPVFEPGLHSLPFHLSPLASPVLLPPTRTCTPFDHRFDRHTRTGHWMEMLSTSTGTATANTSFCWTNLETP